MHLRVVRSGVPAIALAALAAAGSGLAAAPARAGAQEVPAAPQSAGTIRGTITETGTQRPLAGVQVSVAGTRLGAITNAAGAFTITGVPAGQQTVRVRRIGYAPVERSVTVATGEPVALDLSLTVAATQLDQVVVTGTAGAVERRTVGNAITQIDMAEVTRRATVVNVTEALTGKTPGVTLLPGSGAPGTAAEINIRGNSSFLSNRPIVLVDGVRYNQAGLGNYNPTGSGLAGQAQSSQVTSGLDFINPNDIESIEIIKGPAASTLYGAEAAGGVIQIITKKGSRGQQRTRWGAKVEAGQNSWPSRTLTNYNICTQERIDSTVVVNQIRRPLYPGCQGLPVNTVITSRPLEDNPEALRDGKILRTNLSLTGGGDRYSYYIAGDHDEEQGFYRNNYQDRNSVRSNFSFSPSDRAEFQVNLGYGRYYLRLPYQDESANAILLSAARGRPGRIYASDTLRVGYATVRPDQSNSYYNYTESDRLTLGSTVNVNPLSWFRNRLTFGLDYTGSTAEIISQPSAFDVPEGLTAQRVPRIRVYTVDYAGSVVRALTSNLESTTSAGAQVVSTRADTLAAVGRQLAAPDVTQIGTAVATEGSNGLSEYNSVGYFLQQQLGWNNRLFVTGALRADDHSSFGKNFDLILYPKASLSYVLSEEPALRGALGALRANEFKLRAAYGRAGRAPAPYSAIQTYSVNRTAMANDLVVGALRTSTYGNPDLKPETSTEVEAGFDAAFFDSRVSTELTYYNKESRDLLVEVTLPGSTGFPVAQNQNFGRSRNYGLELGINATPLQRPNFGWDARLTFAANRNKLVTIDTLRRSIIPSQPYGQVQESRVGYPFGAYWVRLPRRDSQGRDSIAGTAVILDTAKYLGPSTPTREIGLSNTFTFFKNFQLYSLFDYKGGHYLFNLKESNRCTAAGNRNCERVNDPRAIFPTTAQDSVLARQLLVDQQVPGTYVEKADFIKLREVSLSYSLPTAFVARTGASAASLTLAGRNLALWSDYSGLDPEVNTYSSRQFSRVDAYAAPQARRVTFSINLTY